MENQLVFLVNSQHEFWRREMGGLILEKDDKYLESITNLIARGHLPIVQIDPNFAEINQLRTLPKSSIIGWCPSDEKFDLTFNKEIAKVDAFKLILRPYKLEKTKFSNSLSSFRYTLANLQSARSIFEVLRTLRWQLRGFSMQRRQAKILKIYSKRKRKFHNIPIGYTNVFALSLALKLGASSTESLLERSEPSDDFPEMTISFVGQSGQVVREFAIRAAESNQFGSIIRRAGYGASNVIDPTVSANGIEYINQISSSRFVLSPPGNISGESFRTYEAMVMRRIPLVLNHVTSDPNFKSDYSFLNSFKSKRNWMRLLEESREIDVTTYKQIVLKNSENSKRELELLKKMLIEASNSY